MTEKIDISGDGGGGQSPWFTAIVAVFITTLITANIIAVKLIDIGGYILPAAIIVFPISYIVGDVLTEVYGYHRARRVIWLGFACNLFAVAAIWAAGLLPAAGSGTAARPMSVFSAPRRASWRHPSRPIWWASSPTPMCSPR